MQMSPYSWAVLHVAQQTSGKKIPFEESWIHPDEYREPWSQEIDVWLEEITRLSSHMEWLRHFYGSPQKQTVLAQGIVKHIKLCHDHGVIYTTIGSMENYPHLLRHIPNPPLGLSFLGTPPSQPCLGLVGSRKASFGALRESADIGAYAAKNGFCLVSGGAYGCDITAHKGSLSTEINPLHTATVFAGGLGVLYPSSHLGIFSQLVKRGGCLISERMWYTEPKPYDFPYRNRIISGLCEKILVIHAGQKSGAMTTCHHALDQGRDILVFHPQFGDETMDGNEKLISEGASSFLNVKDLHHMLFV